MTGLSTVSSLLVNFFMSAIGGRSRTWTLDHTLEGLTAFVEDPADIPEVCTMRVLFTSHGHS